jgi:hypothetical protein
MLVNKVIPRLSPVFSRQIGGAAADGQAALVIQSALMQSRWDAQFASQRAKLVEPSSGVCHPIKSFERYLNP